MKPNIVKFTGKFKDLIPDGWTFQKLFARNYRQYHKTGDGSKWGQGCRIWQHHGGYLEIADLYNYSALIVKQIEDGKLIEWGYFPKNGGILGPPATEPVYWLILDRQEKKFISYGSEEYRKTKEILWREGISKEEIRAYGDRYREFNLDEEVAALIQDLISKGWIKSAYDPKFEKKS